MRLTEKYEDDISKGIMVRESYDEKTMKTLFRKYDSIEGYYGSCDEGYCALEKLYNYENAEEEGTLLKLPCKVPSTVYVIECNDLYVRPERIYKINISKDGIYFLTDRSEYSMSAFNKLVFKAYDEAYIALQKLKASRL